MGKEIKRCKDWCPECGHLLPPKTWSCSFCGWSLHELKRVDSRFYSCDDYSDLNKLSSIDKDIERLFENS